MISNEYLKSIMLYDEHTGNLTWLVNKARAVAGDLVGSLDHYGYLTTSIDGTKYKNHRLIWFYVYNTWPEGVLDHIDGIKNNNKLSNLRDVDQMVNGNNRTKLNKNNTSGYPGVYKDRNKWAAEIIYKGEKFRLGNHNTPLEANEARIAFMEEYNI